MERVIGIDDSCEGITLAERSLLRQFFDETFKEDRFFPWFIVDQTSGKGN
jgi:hypothetical protein